MSQTHETAHVGATPATNRDHSESISELIRSLATDLSTLFGKEIELAKHEVGESVSDAQTAVGGIVTGAAVAMAGLVVLFMSAVYGLSNVVDPWLAALIVGATALLVGYLMVNSAKKKMSANSIMPDRTMESVTKDKETLERAAR